MQREQYQQIAIGAGLLAVVAAIAPPALPAACSDGWVSVGIDQVLAFRLRALQEKRPSHRAPDCLVLTFRTP